MRFDEFNKPRTNEALPALGAAAAGAAKAVGAAGKAAGKVAGQAAKAVGAVATKATTSAGKSMASKVAQKAAGAAAKQILKRGNSIPMPTQSGKPAEFEIDDVQGDEVTLINPDARKKPEEPEKVTYKKKDLDTIIKDLATGPADSET